MANKVEVEKLSNEELKSELAGLEQHLADIRYRNATTPIANTSEIKSVRRQVARLHTEVRARELKVLAAAGELPARDKKVARRRRERRQK